MTPKQIQMASTCGITFPTIRPLFTSPPKPTALQAWIENQDFSSYPEATTIAKKMAANIRCISFNEFLLGLQQTIIDFNARCKEPYVLWIAQDSPRKLAAGCSEQWVAGLALEQCGLRWPEAIVVSDDLDGYLERNPSIKNILFIDDAAYSGTHLKRELTPKLNHFKTNKMQGINIFFAIPFMTQKCRVDIIGGLKNEFQEVNCISLKHESLAIIGDILTTSEKECAKTMDSVDINLTLTYFDHKYPDFMSTSMILESGRPLLNLTIVNRGTKPRIYGAGIN